MLKIRHGLIVLSVLFCSVTSAKADISIGIGLPNVSIGINLPLFPQLVPVPGYPIYYAPQVNANYFFYDGMYWVYQDDNWYASTWYNGPWDFVEPEVVPLFVLRIPVRYYRQPPVYFRGWQPNAPPRWDQHWGPQWQQRRGGWERWNRRSVPSRAPLPVYQRQFSGDRYPHQVEQQHKLRSQSYRYQPRDKAVQQQFKRVEHRQSAPVQRGRQEAPPVRRPSQNDQRQQVEQRQHNQRQQVEQRQHEQKQQVEQKQHEQKQQVEQRQHNQRQQIEQKQHEQKQQVEQKQQREQQAPKAQKSKQNPQERGSSQDQRRGRGQDQDKDDGRGRGRDK
ncbi:MAG: hypothetical protein PHH91_09645 [Desulfuromonadaceae bacterium]|nr:hypothetical protein [Desulfuromonadaceae bacterium]